MATRRRALMAAPKVTKGQAEGVLKIQELEDRGSRSFLPLSR